MDNNYLNQLNSQPLKKRFQSTQPKQLFAAEHALIKLLSERGDDVLNLNNADVYRLMGVSSSTYDGNFPGGIPTILRLVQQRLIKRYKRFANTEARKKILTVDFLEAVLELHITSDGKPFADYKITTEILVRVCNTRYAKELLVPLFPRLMQDAPREYAKPELVRVWKAQIAAMYWENLLEWCLEGFEENALSKYRRRIKEQLDMILKLKEYE